MNLSSFPIVFAESQEPHSLFATLFWVFLIAALVWLVIWLLFGGNADELPEKEEAPVASPKKEEQPAPAKPAPPAKQESAEDIADDFEAASEEEAASLFTAELDAGHVRQDPVYGIVYNEKPDEVDDLKKISGIANVLEGKLNGIGVYRFKQVAVWTDAACREFSKMLTFKNRIYRDNWLAQAKQLHEEKYGEKL